MQRIYTPKSLNGLQKTLSGIAPEILTILHIEKRVR